MVAGPSPRTRRRSSSIDSKGRIARCSISRRARLGPTCGKASRTLAGAVLGSTDNTGTTLDMVRESQPPQKVATRNATPAINAQSASASRVWTVHGPRPTPGPREGRALLRESSAVAEHQYRNSMLDWELRSERRVSSLPGYGSERVGSRPGLKSARSEAGGMAGIGHGRSSPGGLGNRAVSIPPGGGSSGRIAPDSPRTTPRRSAVVPDRAAGSGSGRDRPTAARRPVSWAGNSEPAGQGRWISASQRSSAWGTTGCRQARPAGSSPGSR